MKLLRPLLLLWIVLMLADFSWRGVGNSYYAEKNDFSDPYFAATLWRQGQNPYDRVQATALSVRTTNNHIPIVPIYPPTAYVLVAPITLLSWPWANVLWACLTLVAVVGIAYLAMRIGRFKPWSSQAWLVVAAVLTLPALHTGMHVANVAVMVFALCLAALYLADKGRDVATGVLLAVATCLKPQLGIWFLLFYLVRWRWRVLVAAAATGGLLSAIAFAAIPLSFRAVLENYSANLTYWFGTGGQNDFTPANRLHFQLINLQALLYPIVHHATTSNLLAAAIFAVGLAVWAWAIFIHRRDTSDLLAVTTLIALSLLPFYHRSYETGILVLVLIWAIGRVSIYNTLVCKTSGAGQRVYAMALLAMVPLLLPGQAFLVRMEPHLLPAQRESWWWNFVVAPHQIWALFAIILILLWAMFTTSENLGPNEGENLEPRYISSVTTD